MPANKERSAASTAATRELVRSWSTVYVTLKAALALPYLDAIQAIAKRHERVSRCPTTGEILCGGNVHASVIAGPAYADQRALIERSAQVTAEMFPVVA